VSISDLLKQGWDTILISSMHPDLVIGIDSGGTTTRAALAERSGRVLGFGGAGSGNLRDAGATTLAARIDEATHAAFDAAGFARGLVRAGFLGIAGCSTEDDQRAVRAGVKPLDLAPPGSLTIDHDLRTAHAGAFLDEPGMVLIAGTGSCCYGRTSSGDEHRAGGWGSRLDDGGSATWLGLRAVAAWCRAVDGRGAASGLCDSLPEHLGVRSPRDAVALLEAPDSRARLSSLAPFVTRAAAEGDAVALAIVERGASELAEMVVAVHDALARDGSDVPHALSPVGGVFAAGPIVVDALSRALEARLRSVAVVEPVLPPVLGAVFLALQSLGPVSEAQRETLRRSRPD